MTYIVYLIANSRQVHSQETYVRTPQSTRKTLAPTEYNQAYDTSEAPSLRNGKFSSAPVSLGPPLHYVLGPQPGSRRGDKKPVYVLNITIPPIFVDNHVEPSKSAVNIQVRPFCASKSCRRLTHQPRIMQSYTPSSRESLKSFWLEIRLSSHLLGFNPKKDQLKTRESDEGSQITRFPFIHQDHPKNHIPPQNLTVFLQSRNSRIPVALNVPVLAMDAALVVTNVCTPGRGTILILIFLRVLITAKINWI